MAAEHDGFYKSRRRHPLPGPAHARAAANNRVHGLVLSARPPARPPTVDVASSYSATGPYSPPSRQHYVHCTRAPVVRADWKRNRRTPTFSPKQTVYYFSTSSAGRLFPLGRRSYLVRFPYFTTSNDYRANSKIPTSEVDHQEIFRVGPKVTDERRKCLRSTNVRTTYTKIEKCTSRFVSR